MSLVISRLFIVAMYVAETVLWFFVMKIGRKLLKSLYMQVKQLKIAKA